MAGALADFGRGQAGRAAPLVHAVVVNRDGAGLLAPCVRHLLECGYPRLAVTVVDNASGDGSDLATASLFPQISLARNEKNLGLGGGANVGLRLALEQGADFAWVLNNDVLAPPGVLEGLLGRMAADPTLGACQPLLVFTDEPGIVQSAGCGLGLTGRCWDLGAGARSSEIAKCAPAPAAVTGACMLLRVSSLREAGLFDEKFFMYFEDVELCLRLVRFGYAVACLAGIQAFHAGSATASKLPPWRRIFWCERNALVLAARHYSPGLALAVLVLGPLSALAAALARLARLQPAEGLAYLCGALAGLTLGLGALTRRESGGCREITRLVSRGTVFPPKAGARILENRAKLRASSSTHELG